MPRGAKMAAKMAALLPLLPLLAAAGPCRGGPGLRGDAESCGVTLTLEHSLEPDGSTRYRRRGTLSWSPGGDPVLTQRPLSEEERRALRELAARDGLYRLRVARGDGFLASCERACALLESGLSEELSVHLDVGGQLVALGAVALGTCRGRQVQDEDLQLFNTSVLLRQPLPAAVPETAAFIKHLEQEQAQRARNPQEQKSFFARYWMYIIPIVLFLMMSGAPDAGGQGGGAGGRGGRGGALSSTPPSLLIPPPLIFWGGAGGK